MKTPLPLNVPAAPHTRLYRLLVGSLLSIVLAAPAVAADSNESFQYNALFNPSKSELMAEARGRVMIYDGLDNAVVERALDAQFDRIEHMMFTRIRQAPPKNDATPQQDDEKDSAEDDGC